MLFNALLSLVFSAIGFVLIFVAIYFTIGVIITTFMFLAENALMTAVVTLLLIAAGLVVVLWSKYND